LTPIRSTIYFGSPLEDLESSGALAHDKHMNSERLRRLIDSPDEPALLRGEIWVNGEVLSEGGFRPGAAGRVEFGLSLGGDIIFFHWPESVVDSDLEAVIGFARGAGLDCGLTVDGPFQRLTCQSNVLDLLRESAVDPSAFRRRLAEQMEEIREVIGWVRGLEIGLLIVTEDIAYTGGTYISPDAFRSLLVPFYRELADLLGMGGIALGWHSDGSVEPLIPDLVDSGVRFFSLEPEAVDLLKVKRTYGSQAILISGIRVEWLSPPQLTEEEERVCVREIEALLGQGGFILASSCGIYDPKFIPALKQIYTLTGPYVDARVR
jgi:hypothetical protein